MNTNSLVRTFSDDTFAADVENASGLVVVDFWAPWCAPCRIIAPVIEQLSTEYEGRVTFGKLNVDDNPAVAARYGIRSIPTIGVFRDGEPVTGVAGAAPKAMLAKMIDEALAA